MKDCLIVVAWVAIGVFNYGAVCAEFHWFAEKEMVSWRPTMREYLGITMLVAVVGPFGLPVALFLTNFLQHGWRPWFGQYENHYEGK